MFRGSVAGKCHAEPVCCVRNGKETVGVVSRRFHPTVSPSPPPAFALTTSLGIDGTLSPRIDRLDTISPNRYNRVWQNLFVDFGLQPGDF